MSIGTIILYALAGVLTMLALKRKDDTFRRAMTRAVEQFAILVPRMICALIAAGFIARLIPSEIIARYLGNEAGLTAIVVAAATGALIPAGPVIAFAISAVFARAGASTPALIAFITSWSLFAAHRIFIYEIPMLGMTFLRLRLASVAVLPILAGLIAIAAAWIPGGLLATGL